MNKFTYEDRKRVYYQAQAKFGTEKQAVKAIEELSEATKEICKTLLGCGDRDHLAEEIADATIMLEQLRLFFNINIATAAIMDEKIAALQRRIKEEP